MLGITNWLGVAFCFLVLLSVVSSLLACDMREKRNNKSLNVLHNKQELRRKNL